MKKYSGEEMYNKRKGPFEQFLSWTIFLLKISLQIFDSV